MKIKLLIPITLFLISCNQITKNNDVQINDKQTIEEKTYWNIPNENTKTEILSTNNTINDSILIDKLSKDFSKGKFKMSK